MDNPRDKLRMHWAEFWIGLLLGVFITLVIDTAVGMIH